MRFLFLVAAGSAAATPAFAQTSDWTGPYGGASIGVGGLAKTQVSTHMEHAGWTGANYTGITTVNGSNTFDSEIGSNSKGILGGFLGMAFDQGGLVLGGEVKVELSPVDRVYSIGPVISFPAGPFGVGATFPVPVGPNAPAGSLGNVLQERDTITSNLQSDYNLSARGKIGVPVGDKLLLSAYVGVAVTNAELEVQQVSTQTGAYFFRNTPNGPLFSTEFTNGGTLTSSADEMLIGGTIGAMAEYKLTDQWLGRLDVGYTRYGDISVTNTAGSSVSIEPSTWSATVGLAFRL